MHGFPGYEVGSELPTVSHILDGEAPANNAAVRVDKTPGRGFRYAGGGTTVMQLLVMDTTEQPFADVMRAQVLTPLGMELSTYEQPLPERLEPYAATAHDADGKPIAGRWHVYPEQAAAGLWTNPSELAKYVLEIQSAYRGDSEKVISQPMIAQMLTEQGGGTVGLGPFMNNAGDSRRFGHGGSNEGFKCAFVGFLERGDGAVVMTNGELGGGLVGEILNSIAICYEWPEYLPPVRTLVQLSDETIDKYVGEFFAGPLRIGTITAEDGRLFASSPDGIKIELFFESETEFFAADANLTGRLEPTDDGSVVLAIVLDGSEIRAKKKGVERKPKGE